MKAGIWLRVSSGKQDEQSQLPDCLAHCERNGYEVIKQYVVHGESAYHGEQDPAWQEVISDVQAGVIEVVVLWKVDRLDRRNLLVAVPMVNKALDAGAAVEFATQAFIDLTTSQGRIAFAMFVEMAHEESKVKSDRMKAKQAALRAAGSFAAGAVPYGYTLVPEDGKKVLVPDTQAAEVVRRIFRAVAAGSTLLEVARSLAGIPTGYGKAVWAEGTVRAIIRNAVYRGLLQHGRKVTYAETEPLVTAAEWLAANQALASRGRRPGNGTKGRPSASLLRPVCGRCGGPLYRWGVSYRCAGVGPSGNSAQRHSCGNRIRLETLDAEVWQEFAEHDDPEIVETVIPGSDYAEEIAAVQLAIRDLDSLADDYDTRHAGLVTELRRLRDLPAEPERRSAVFTGRTEGEAFRVMTDAEQRAFIRLWTLTVQPEGSDPRWTLSRDS